MKYFKILDSIELKLKNNDFNPKMDIITQTIVPEGYILHPFDGSIHKCEAYIKTNTLTHKERLLNLWDKIRDYAYFECKYQIPQ